MISRQVIDRFLDQRELAVVGASRTGRKFGNTVYRELKAKGYKLRLVHPQAETIEGERCYPSLRELPGPVGGVVIVVPPNQTEKVVRDAAAAGIKRVWMQQGAESAAAILACEEAGLEVVHGCCILMFAEPAGLRHRVHRGVLRLLGRLPR